MKNKEKYWDKIIEALAYDDVDFCLSTLSEAHPCTMISRDCEKCISNWLEEEYILEIDWSKIKVDTPILVRSAESPDWKHRHFAKVGDDGGIVTFAAGKTSWTKNTEREWWKFAKLAESED